MLRRSSLFSVVFAAAPALALVSANACSGRIELQGSPVSDAATESRDVLQPPPTKDSGPPPSTGEESGPGCGNTEVIDATSFPWKPPTRAPGSCTAAEVGAMIAFVDATPSATFDQLQASITNVACRECVFAKETTTWPPLVLNTPGTAVAAINVGGCPAIVSGLDDCGKAIQQWNNCLDEACVDCPEGSPSQRSKCVQAVNKKACKKAFEDVFTGPACGGAAAAQSAIDACNRPEDKYTFIGGVRAQCVGLSAVGDGGGD